MPGLLDAFPPVAVSGSLSSERLESEVCPENLLKTHMSRAPQSRDRLRTSVSALSILLLVAGAFVFAANGLTAPVTDAQNRGAARPAFVEIFAAFFGYEFAAAPDDTAPEATFTVNSTADAIDANIGDGVCADAAGNCTLRAAIQEANATGAADSIIFNLQTLPAVIQLNAQIVPAELVVTRPVTITGPGARLLTVRGNANTLQGVFNITSGVSSSPAIITNLTVADSGGRGINNDGRLELADVTIRGNTYGIYNTDKLILTRSTITGNSNGGMYFAATSNAVNISNTTVTGNSTPASGGGISSLSTDVTLNNVTVSHNTATMSGGGIYYENAASGMNVRNTLVANNTSALGPDVHSQNVLTGIKIVSRGNNLIGRNSGDHGFTDGVNFDKVGTLASPIDPLLGPLQNNGGPTDTRATLTASPARDAGNFCVTNGTCAAGPPPTPLANDQRGPGFPRAFETGVDIGAFEAFYPAPAIASFAPANWGTGQGAFELTVSGTGFVQDSVVRWNGTARVTTFVSNTEVRAQILAADAASAGQFPVTVVNPTPGGGASPGANFPVTNCVFTLVPTSQNFTAAGGTFDIAVQAPFGCPWTAAVNNANWISITAGSSGRGPGTVSIAVASNNGAARSGTLTIGGQTFTVNQASGCTFTINPTSAPAPAGGGPGSFTLTASNSNCPWNAVSDQTWLTVTNANGTGSATINYSVAANTGPARSAHINIGGQQFTVNQSNGCAFTLVPTTQNFPRQGGSSTFQVNTSAGCAWTAVSSQTWVTVTSGSSGSGPGTVAYSVAANDGAARSATISVNGTLFTVTQDNGCTFSVAPASSNIPAAGQTGVTFAITPSNQNCPWTAAVTQGAGFVTITGGASGTGTGTVTYSVAANTGPVRIGKILAGGQEHTITQASGCSYTLTPTTTTIDQTGGTRSFNVTVNNQLCQWSAGVNVTWITLNAPTSGTGNGTVSFTVQANNTPQRIGDITVNGVVHRVTQADGCVYVLNPSSQTVSPAAGTGNFSVSAGQGCTFTAVSESNWITVTGGTPGTTSGTINFSYQANAGLQRQGTILVRNVRFTLTQQNGCSFTITPDNAPAPAGGGTGSVAVTASDALCPWTAAVNPANPWITVTSGASGTGSGAVQYSVAANVNPQRTGTILIATRTFTVTQASGCVYTLSPTSTVINDLGGTRSFQVQTNGNLCAWSAVPETGATWITVASGASGTGTGSVTLNIAASGGTERVGIVNAGGRQFTVNQVSTSVSNLNDSGVGSLRRAVGNSNLAPGADVITFQPGLQGTITLTSGEIAISDGSPVEVRGPGANRLAISGGNTSRIFAVNGASVTISGLKLTGGNGEGSGSAPDSKKGGAIDVTGGTIVLDAVDISGNTISVPSGPGNLALGGGISIFGGTNHVIRNSTLFNNRSTLGAAVIVQSATLTISNSTLFGNIAEREGGGIYNAGTLVIRNSTITRNSAPPGNNGAGIITWSGGLSLGNTIISENTGAEITFASGEVTSAGNNLVGDQAGDSGNTLNPVTYQATDIRDVPPQLAPLDYYGGLLMTAAILPNSPARDAGSNAGAPAFDARGSQRVINGAVDIGSFELNIDIAPASATLPDAAMGSFYSVVLTPTRFPNNDPNEIFAFSHNGGTLPAGISVVPETGVVLGEPLESGRFDFIVRVVSQTDGMAGVKKYSLTVRCPVAISPQNQGMPAAGGSGGFGITAAAGCNWAAVNNAPSWVTITSPATGSGSGSVTYTVAANSGPQRSGTITVGDQTHTITQNVGSCAFSINPTSSSLPAGAGGGTVNVTAGAGCAWTAQSNNPTWLSVTSGATGSGNGTVSYSVTANSGAARAGTLTIAGQTFTVNQAGAAGARAPFDLDGDGKTDVGVYRPNGSFGGEWWYLRSSDGDGRAFGFGASTDAISPADFTGDGKTDIAVFRPSTGFWYVMRSEDNTFYGFPFGAAGDVPVPADFDADGKADAAVFRAGTWFISLSSGGSRIESFGTASDMPVAADYDGDGKADLAVFRPSGASGAGEWWLNMSTQGVRAVSFGAAGDKAVPADYTGDGKTDVAVFRPSTGFWYILRSEDLTFYGFPFGVAGDVPSTGDYDGDGKADPAVFRAGTWYINRSAAGQTVIGFGTAGDVPVPSAFVR